MKKLIHFAFLLTMLQVKGQTPGNTEKSTFNLKGDFATRYIWRGMGLSTSPCIQPAIDFTSGNFSVGNWNSYTFSREGLQEVDLYLSYKIKSFTLTLNDYFQPLENVTEVKDYFNLKNSTTGHVLELFGEYDGPESFPVKLAAGTFIFGDDKNSSENNMYSTYCEAGMSFTHNGVTIYPYIGFTPYEGYYYAKAGVVNTGLALSKEVKVTDSYNIPVSASFIANPATGNVYVLLTISLF